jgi:hypothetical protein
LSKADQQKNLKFLEDYPMNMHTKFGSREESLRAATTTDNDVYQVMTLLHMMMTLLVR